MDSGQYAIDRFDTILDQSAKYVKPYLPTLARFLLCSTFLEDSVRIITRWDDQTYHLEHDQGFSYHGTISFLVLNVMVMLTCSTLAILKKQTDIAVGGLFAVVLSQCYGYGLYFNRSWMLRSISVSGGLLMLLADAMSARKKRELFAPLLTNSIGDATGSKGRKTSLLQLLGRSLLVALFLSFMFAGELSAARLAVAAISFVGCVMVVVGFKAKWSAWVLLSFLCISNVVLNNWWTLHHEDPKRDFQKFDFFQTLSVMGGFLLLVNSGPGGLSMDEKKKDY
ncbi:SURF4 family-domain-containing protein [Chytriomyces sp. MP71]|nr:SURF4 family-domain-containing protein [Chytriomyces sp. MP71]